MLYFYQTNKTVFIAVKEIMLLYFNQFTSSVRSTTIKDHGINYFHLHCFITIVICVTSLKTRTISLLKPILIQLFANLHIKEHAVCLHELDYINDKIIRNSGLFFSII